MNEINKILAKVRLNLKLTPYEKYWISIYRGEFLFAKKEGK